MNKTGWFIVIILNCIYSYSQTDVNGKYFVNTTWDISGSPYNVTGDLQVTQGITLYIEPGVEINYAGNYEILVNGTINITGTNQQPVIFSGNLKGLPMLMFKSCNLSNSKLSHIIFNGPKKSIQISDESELNQDLIKNSGILNINNTRFNNSIIETKGYFTNASLIIDSSSIFSTTINNAYTYSEAIEITNSNIQSSFINPNSISSGITIRNSYIYLTSFTVGCYGANLNIFGSNLVNSYVNNLLNDTITGRLKISLCKLKTTVINMPFSKVEISESDIEYNKSTCLKFGRGIIECSQIKGSGTGIAIEISGSNNSTDGNASIKNSSIINNSVGIKISAANNVTIDSCNFENNSTYDIENTSENNIIASENWWGSSDSVLIAGKIYDYYEDVNSGIVFFSNNLNTAYYSHSCPDTIIVPSADFENYIVQKSSDYEVKLFPNPSSGHFTLEYRSSEEKHKPLSIEFFNTYGVKLYTEILPEYIDLKEIDISFLSAGIYFCKVQMGEKSVIEKLIINKHNY